jgi:uncharacterized membrane protein YgdD (TMEM256/DUF423 family)
VIVFDRRPRSLGRIVIGLGTLVIAALAMLLLAAHEHASPARGAVVGLAVAGSAVFSGTLGRRCLTRGPPPSDINLWDPPSRQREGRS